MDLQKKKRSENWSSEEKEILRQIIADSADIIENKSTKTNINIEKAKTWKMLTNKFNQVTGKNRTVRDLKLAWKRMKIMAKANLSTQKIQNSKTGVLKKIEIRKQTNHKSTNTPNIKKFIMESNIDLKKRQLEMLEEEHVFNIKIAELKIKKLQLEISLLADKKTPSNI